MELEADDTRDTNSFSDFKGNITQTVSAKQYVRAEMATRGVRHALAVTTDTCFHENEGGKVDMHLSRITFNYSLHI